MITRTFKQLGKAYGPETLSIRVLYAGKEIFNGPVPTVDEPGPDWANVVWPFGDELFTWTEDIDYVGAKELKIQVTGNGYLLLTSSVANYVCVEASVDPYITVPGGPDVYNGFYSQKFDGYDVHDPLTDVKIGGVEQSTEQGPTVTGQWTWYIPGGMEFVCNVNVNRGRHPDDIGSQEIQDLLKSL